MTTGELIDDHHSLVRVINDVLNAMPGESLKYLIVDEVTYIKDWDKGVKYLADAGLLENIILILLTPQIKRPLNKFFSP